MKHSEFYVFLIVWILMIIGVIIFGSHKNGKTLTTLQRLEYRIQTIESGCNINPTNFK